MWSTMPLGDQHGIRVLIGQVTWSREELESDRLRVLDVATDRL